MTEPDGYRGQSEDSSLLESGAKAAGSLRTVISHLSFLFVILTGACLLFLIQPLEGKRLLPIFGGAPTVWITCLFFFQVVLLISYGYVFLLSKTRLAWVWPVHAAVVLLSPLALLFQNYWPAAPDARASVGQLLLLLCVHVGIPSCVLGTTAVTLQVLLARLKYSAAPYKWYAVSNCGSLAGLLAFPFIMEPALSTHSSLRLWTFAYIGHATAYALLVATTTRTAGRLSPPLLAQHSGSTVTIAVVTKWIGAAALGNALLLTITAHITADIAAVPLLWVVPVVVYLLSYVVAFSGYYHHSEWRNVFIAATVCYFLQAWLGAQFGLVAALALLGAGATLCHGQLARMAPATHALGYFYLSIAGGGALAGAAIVVGAPLIFNDNIELPIVLTAVAALVIRGMIPTRPGGRYLLRLVTATAVGLVAVGAAFWRPFVLQRANVVESERNFFGVKVIEERASRLGTTRMLRHGTTIHGAETLKDGNRIGGATYYSAASGIGVAMANHQARAFRDGLDVAVVGLGTGTMVGLAKPEDRLVFLEIDPQVIALAYSRFSYLKNASMMVSVLRGDARVTLEELRSDGQGERFDLLAVDAFSGDAVPVHLLTLEAFELYDALLRPHGMVAIHASNRFLKLRPVVGAKAYMLGWRMAVMSTSGNSDGGYPSEWLLLGSSIAMVGLDAAIVPRDDTRPWTDTYSDLLGVIRLK